MLIFTVGANADPDIISGVGCFAAMSLLQAATAVGNMFARPGVEYLKPLAQEIKSLADRSRSEGG